MSPADRFTAVATMRWRTNDGFVERNARDTDVEETAENEAGNEQDAFEEQIQ